MSEIFYIEVSNLDSFINRLRNDYCVYLPVAKENNFTKETDYSYTRNAQDTAFIFNPYRVVEPLKSFFTPASDKVTAYFNGGRTPKNQRKTVIFGVKSCDIAGHKIQDFVFLEGVDIDSEYRLKRENTLLISSDCIDFKEVCHCLAWDILPHPTQGFDLNLSALNDGYLVEVGSAKGKDLIEQYNEYFTPAKEAQVAGRQVKRENLINRLQKYLLPQNLVSPKDVQRLMKEGYHLNTWQEFMLTCVECGGCNLICDTCHCFLLADSPSPCTQGLGENAKVRTWDSCLYVNYARVAGGANPLKTRAQRLRNRFMKKFDFFIDNLGIPACCGCGRCIEVCPGKIDIREVLKDVAKKLSASA